MSTFRYYRAIAGRKSLIVVSREKKPTIKRSSTRFALRIDRSQQLHFHFPNITKMQTCAGEIFRCESLFVSRVLFLFEK